MFLNGATDYTGYSDSDLDQAYADAYRQYVSATTDQEKINVSVRLSDISQEILSREATAGGYVFALFGSRFPQYDAIQKSTGGFVAHDQAIASTAEAAGNVAENLASGAKQVLQAGSMLGLGAMALFALYLMAQSNRR